MGLRFSSRQYHGSKPLSTKTASGIPVSNYAPKPAVTATSGLKAVPDTSNRTYTPPENTELNDYYRSLYNRDSTKLSPLGGNNLTPETLSRVSDALDKALVSRKADTSNLVVKSNFDTSFMPPDNAPVYSLPVIRDDLRSPVIDPIQPRDNVPVYTPPQGSPFAPPGPSQGSPFARPVLDPTQARQFLENQNPFMRPQNQGIGSLPVFMPFLDAFYQTTT